MENKEYTLPLIPYLDPTGSNEHRFVTEGLPQKTALVENYLIPTGALKIGVTHDLISISNCLVLIGDGIQDCTDAVGLEISIDALIAYNIYGNGGPAEIRVDSSNGKFKFRPNQEDSHRGQKLLDYITLPVKLDDGSYSVLFGLSGNVNIETGQFRVIAAPIKIVVDQDSTMADDRHTELLKQVSALDVLRGVVVNARRVNLNRMPR